jgi:hypothetical protein
VLIEVERTGDVFWSNAVRRQGERFSQQP